MLQRPSSDTATTLVLASLTLLHVSPAAAFPASEDERSWYRIPEAPKRQVPHETEARPLPPAAPGQSCTHELERELKHPTPPGPRKPHELAIQSHATSCQEFREENVGKRLGEFAAGMYYLRQKSLGAPRRLADGATWIQQGDFVVDAVGATITVPARAVVPWSGTPTDADKAAWDDFWERLLAHERGHEAILNDWIGEEISVAGYGNNAREAQRAFRENHKRAERALAERIDQALAEYHLVAGESVVLECGTMSARETPKAATGT